MAILGAAAPDTPPYTPQMNAMEGADPAETDQAIVPSGGQPVEQARTAQELEDMLKEAHRVIQERERGALSLLFNVVSVGWLTISLTCAC